MDTPKLRKRRRVHFSRRGDRSVSNTGNRQANHTLEGQRTTRLRDLAEQILLPLSAAATSEGSTSRILEVGKSGGEDAGGFSYQVIDTYQIDSAPSSEWLSEVPNDWGVRRIKRVVSRVDYGISESTKQEGRFAVLKMGHLQGGEIKFSNLDFVDE